MKTRFKTTCAATLIALAGLAGIAPMAYAQAGSSGQVARERATCDGVQQDRAACLREAGAAAQEARRGGLSAPAGAYDQNALARCQTQPAADRADCEKRITGAGRTTTEGSVMGGGVIRETVTTVPGPAR